MVANRKHRPGDAVKPPRSIGERLADARRVAAISLRELARRSGVSVGHLSRLERSLQEPTIGLLTAIAGALGLGIVDLLLDPGDDLRHQVMARTAGLDEEQLREVLGVLGRLQGSIETPTGLLAEPWTTVVVPRRRKETSRTRLIARRRPRKG